LQETAGILVAHRVAPEQSQRDLAQGRSLLIRLHEGALEVLLAEIDRLGECCGTADAASVAMDEVHRVTVSSLTLVVNHGSGRCFTRRYAPASVLAPPSRRAHATSVGSTNSHSPGGTPTLAGSPPHANPDGQHVCWVVQVTSKGPQEAGAGAVDALGGGPPQAASKRPRRESVIFMIPRSFLGRTHQKCHWVIAGACLASVANPRRADGRLAVGSRSALFSARAPDASRNAGESVITLA